ncbi:MAG: hypothetical protein RI900_3034, partial [Actinomycetota bacterium]
MRRADMRPWTCVLILLCLLLGACGIANDDSPRDVPTAQQQQLGVLTDRSAGAARGAGRIYLLAPTDVGQASMLQGVARDVDGAPADLLEALLSGPNAAEIGRQFRSAIPTGTTLLSARLQGGVLVADLSAEFLQSTGSDVVDALAQVVFTASEADGVRSVRVLVDGELRQWPTGNGELQAAPLTVYDYPGRVASAQPAY